jgi:hypothetical protein
MEHNMVKATESGSMLVLFADGFLQDIDLDVACPSANRAGGRNR